MLNVSTFISISLIAHFSFFFADTRNDAKCLWQCRSADNEHKFHFSFLLFLQRCSSLERPLSATSNSRNSNASNASARQCPSPIPAHVAKGRKLFVSIQFDRAKRRETVRFSFAMTCGLGNLWNCTVFHRSNRKKFDPDRNYVLYIFMCLSHFVSGVILKFEFFRVEILTRKSFFFIFFCKLIFLSWWTLETFLQNIRHWISPLMLIWPN